MKLYYFDLYARAETIRLFLHYVKKDFEDVRISFEDWGKDKASFGAEFGQLPVFEWEGKKLSQSRSILRRLCQEYGFYPTDKDEIYLVESWIDAHDDATNKMAQFMMEKDEERKKDLGKELTTKYIPNSFGGFEKRLTEKSNKDFAVGDKLTMADFVMANFYISIVQLPAQKDNLEKALEHFPAFHQYLKTRGKDFEEYAAQRKPCAF